MILGYVGGALEAYSRCVVDDQKELKTKYDAWQQLQHNAPALAEQAHTELVASCQRQFSTLDKLRNDKISLETQLRQASAVLRTAPTSPTPPLRTSTPPSASAPSSSSSSSKNWSYLDRNALKHVRRQGYAFP